VADHAITAVVLAGGLGSRMGGVDKGLQAFQGHPLALQVCHRIQPQVAQIVINANRHAEVYQGWGWPVYPDAHADFPGPLAGFAVGLAHARTPYVLAVPCDTPRLPLDLAQRLHHALVQAQADIAMASAPQTDEQGQVALEPQPTCCLLKTSLLPSLQAFLKSGGRKVRAWTSAHDCVQVAFDQPNDDPLAFCNLNTLAELQVLEQTPPHSS
jgi:molybdopterin-guanine dinucleotide biosynthesis protein A